MPKIWRKRDELPLERISLSFEVPGLPVAQPRQRQGIVHGRDGQAHAINFLPKKHPVNTYKATIKIAASNAGARISESPFSVSITFVFPRPKRLIRKRGVMIREWHHSKPDLDNCEKAVMDALTNVIWRDDSQICIKVSSKVYADLNESPRTLIEVEEL